MHAKNKISEKEKFSSIELIKLSCVWEGKLKIFLNDLGDQKDGSFFSPHPIDETSINQIVNVTGKDLYYLLVDKEEILGYGLLRGWDEGYHIPSLGIAIHPSARNIGLGRVFMFFLHSLAFQRGAAKVRLRVHQDNDKAIKLYKSLGYVFEIDKEQAFYLIGLKNIGSELFREL